MKKIRKEISEFYKKIFSNAIFKNKIQEKTKKVVTEADLRKLIREDIMPLMKKENLNYSEEDLLEYEEETLKNLPKDALADVSGGVSVKSALLTGGILSMALFGGVSLNASAMDVDPTASTPQQTRRSSQQQNNNNGNANQPGNNGNDNHNAVNNNDRARAWRNRLYGLLNNLPPDVQRWATSLSLIEKGLIVSDGNYLFFFNNKTGSISPLLPSDVTVFIFPSMVWDVNENVHHVNRVNRFVGIGSSKLSKITEFIADPSVKNLTIASRCFAGNKNLDNVDLQSLENLIIEEGAFDGCEGLSKITFPNLKSLTIPRRCCADNKTLKSIDFRSVENLIIEEGAFDGCENLVELILPENPTNVSIENAFTGCNSLDKTLLVEKYGYVETSVNINNDTGTANNPSPQNSNNDNNPANITLPKNRNVSVSNRNINNFSPIDKNAYLENATFRYFERRLSDDVKNSKEFREAMKTGWLLESRECLLSFDFRPIFNDFSSIYLYVPDDVSEVTINAEAWNIIFGNKHIFPNYRLERIYGGKNLKKIKLGYNIESFGFAGSCCDDLKALLEEVDASGAHNVIIYSGAFLRCKNLKKFIGAENTEIIGLAFFNCASLCDVILPADARIADDAFKGCTSLKGILPLKKNSNNNVHTANINNDNGTTNNPAPQDSDNGNNKHPKQFSRPCISASTILLPSEPAPQNTSSNEPDDDDNNNNLASDTSQHQGSNNDNHAANNLASQGSNNGSSGHNENTENKNDVSVKHNDGSNNNESVDEYNDEDYSVDIDEIMASQIRAFGKNPEMMTLDRNAAIKIANNNYAANNVSHQDSNDGAPDHKKNIENKNDAANNATPQDSNNGSSNHNENTKNKNNDKVPYIQKNANGKIIFVIPIWCDVIKGWAFDYSANIANPEEQARFKKMIESVEILVVPPNVKEIGIRALQGWPNLKKIIFIDGWPQLDGGSFADCSQLKKVESIGDSSNRPDVSSSKSRIPFTRCNNLEEIDIADNVVYTTSLIVDTDNHEYGKKLKKISMPKRTQIVFCEFGSIDYSVSIEDLHFPIGSSCKSFKISNWTKLEELDVPFVFNGLTPSKKLPPWDNLSVENCNSLKKINIRGDVRAINAGRTLDESAGYYRYNNVVYIWNCLKLEEVTLPPSLEYVGGNFDNLIWGECPNLKKITFLSEKIYFGEKSFSPQAFPDLKPEYSEDFFNSENFPDGCKICLPYAKEIYVDGKKYDIPNDNPDNAIEIVKINYNERDNYDEDITIIDDENKICFVFQKVLDKKDAELMLNGSIPGWDAKNRILSIPEYYCEIVEEAFKNNNYKEINIPYSVKKIGKEAFANCSELESITFTHSVPKLSNNAFSDCKKLEYVVASGESNGYPNEQNLTEVFSNCPNFKGIMMHFDMDWDENSKSFRFVTIDQVKSWDGKNFGKILICFENVYFEKGFFNSEYFPEGFKIYLLDPKEICVDCEKIPITKEDNNSKDNHDEEDSDYEDNFQYKVGEKIPLPENISSSGASSEEEEEALEKGIILIKTNPEKEKVLNPTSNPILKYGWQIESYSD